MKYPLLHLVATQPQLLLDHAEAYVDLVVAELGQASTGWKQRALLGTAALCCLCVATVLGGVALMLWAVTPASAMQAPWALIATPMLPIVMALGCLVVIRRQNDNGDFDSLRQQIKADMAMLREATLS